MSGYRLTWRERPAGAVDAATLRPDLMCALAVDDLKRTRLLCGRVWRELGDLFHVKALTGDGGPRLELQGHAHFIRLAAEMAAGNLIVDGDGGLFAAAGMRGGRVKIRGSVGDGAAAAMAGGELFIHGPAGDRLAGPLPGSLRGMQGGEVVVLGSAGGEVGLRQRRGLVAVAGNIGPLAGHHMRAGTIVLGGSAPALPGVGMQRGTIIAFDPATAPPASFRRDGTLCPPIWPLLARRLRALGFPVGQFDDHKSFHLSSGDRRGMPRGELWVAAS